MLPKQTQVHRHLTSQDLRGETWARETNWEASDPYQQQKSQLAETLYSSGRNAITTEKWIFTCEKLHLHQKYLSTTLIDAESLSCKILQDS